MATETTTEAHEEQDAHAVEAGSQESGHEGETMAHTEVAHGDDHGSAGMPQLDTSTYGNQIFWLVICLLAVYFLLSRIALPRIGSTIEGRAQAIQRDLDRAAEMKMRAEEAEAQYEQALLDARTKAHEIAEKTKAEIQAELDVAAAEADKEIAKQSSASAKRIAKLQTEAEASVKDVASEVTRSLLDALAPGSADDKAISGALGKILKG